MDEGLTREVAAGILASAAHHAEQVGRGNPAVADFYNSMARWFRQQSDSTAQFGINLRAVETAEALMQIRSGE